ncbi:hypothetical protein M3Y99_01606300 [Aphelenchoides fujianensis]|nr:hypothetical protein M3Y99_01606300 [Aphelenchoides fujianensis]
MGRAISNESVLFFPLTVEWTAENRRAIALVVIVNSNRTAANYALAQSTLRCYALLFGYPLLEVVLEHERVNREEGAGKDVSARFFFNLFSCTAVMARLMEERPTVEWFVFLNADVGVVNPDRLLEEFVDGRADLAFNDRLFTTRSRRARRGARLARAAYEFRGAVGSRKWRDNGVISGSLPLLSIFLDHFCGRR